jgi:hypothetical protein
MEYLTPLAEYMHVIWRGILFLVSISLVAGAAEDRVKGLTEELEDAREQITLMTRDSLWSELQVCMDINNKLHESYKRLSRDYRILGACMAISAPLALARLISVFWN